MNPKQTEWIAMQRVADLRREAASWGVVATATTPTRDRLGRWSTLATSRAFLQNVIRGAFRAVHLIGPRGRPIS
jgi:hypothetical protein